MTTPSLEINWAIESVRVEVGTRKIVHLLGETRRQVEEHVPAIHITLNRKETTSLDISDAWKLGTWLLKNSSNESEPIQRGNKEAMMARMRAPIPKPGELGIAVNGDIEDGGPIVLNFERAGSGLTLWFRLEEKGPVVEVTIPRSEATDLRDWLAERPPMVTRIRNLFRATKG